MEKIGLIAGNSFLPLFFLKRARQKGYQVYTLAIKKEASRKIAGYSTKTIFLPPGRLDEGVHFFAENNIKQAVMLGLVRHSRLLRQERLDSTMQGLLGSLSDWRASTILKTIMDYFQEHGVKFLPSNFLLEDLFLKAGTLYGKPLSPNEEANVRLGCQVASTLAELDVGLTVVLKDGIVLALEGVEGTNHTIRRAGRFTPHVVVVKVNRPRQDLRFDLPVIGPTTIKVLKRVSGRVLAISSGTMVLEIEKVVSLLKRYGITLTVFPAPNS